MQEDPANLSILAFVLKNSIVTEKGEPLSFHDRRFFLDILTDFNNEQVIKKAAQIGGSVLYTIKTLWVPKYRGWNVIYTFPSDDDVREFVSSKTNKIIAANQQVFSGLQTDNIERKEIGDRFIFYKGTISKTAAIMTSADLLIHDEADRSDQKALEMYQSRLKASQFKGRWIFSNPTTEKGAVDLMWQRSDKREWEVTCNSCKKDQFLTFPASINLEKKFFQCIHCGASMPDEVRRMGRWKATAPAREGEKKPSGYHISHLMCPWITAAEIVKDSEGDQEYFFNFVLGEPYNPGDMQVTRNTVLDAWTPKNLVTGRYFLGVDVGNIKHYALGSEKGLIKIGRFSVWSDLDSMMDLYKPTLVIDAMPDNTMSRYYVSKYRNAYMSYFKQNLENPKQLYSWGEREKYGIVYSSRNRILDHLISEIASGRVLFGVTSDKELKEFVKHYETLRRVKVTNTQGIELYEWQSTTGVDHYVFATLYWYLAVQSSGDGGVFSALNGPKTSITEQKADGEYLNVQKAIQEVLERGEF